MKNRLFPFILPGASRQKEIPSSSGAPLIRVKRILTCLTLLLFSGDLHAEADPSSEAPRDHVLFITIDDLNDWIGCMTDPIAPDAPSGGRVVGRGHAEHGPLG
jgi:hypothetical protein